MPFAADQIDAVFFDLDDTLTDTAGQLIDGALRDAARRMVEAGLPAEVEPVARFLQARVASRRGGDYFTAAAESFGAPGSRHSAIARAGRQAFLARPVPEIAPLPAARRLLRLLRRRCRVFLVTGGDPETQREKLERLGLEGAFDAVRCVDSLRGHGKLDAFRELLETHRLEAARCLCVGDRVAGEIADGNRLGMWTVRVRRGEFAAAEPSSAAEVPDFTVGDLAGVAALLGLELPAHGAEGTPQGQTAN